MSLKLKMTNPSANIIIAPSDHLIGNQDKFTATCEKALEFTKHNDALVTIGIKPNRANTGYGYIQSGDGSFKDGFKNVIRFTEKPNKALAKEFLEDGSYLWNSGIFIWKAEDIVKAFMQYMPRIIDIFWSVSLGFDSIDEKSIVHRIYKQCDSISIDYAILEKAKNVFVFPANFSWSDLGTWNSAWENIEKDDLQNAVSGANTLMIDANGCIVHSTEKKLVLIGGVEDLIVINTNDALMVCRKENEQQIKDYLVKVKQSKGLLYL